MAYIGNRIWARYKSIINKVHDDFSQEEITWMRFESTLQRWGEDDGSNDKFTPIILKVLIMFNDARTWPVTRANISGDIDMESMMVLFNLNYLNSLGYVDSNKKFAMDPGKDYFIHQGNSYKPAGETPEAQAHDENLFFGLILSRTPTNTGYTALNQIPIVNPNSITCDSGLITCDSGLITCDN